MATTKKVAATPKKRNPQDATLRNIRAAAKQRRAMQVQLDDQQEQINRLRFRLEALERGRRL